MIFIHELGHFIAAKYLNIKVRFGNITPLGAYIIHESTENSFQNAFIALLGPIFGSVCALVYYCTGSLTFFILSFISVFTNLINLIPALPLDGGHISMAISPKICYMGFPFLVYFLIKAKTFKSRFFYFILLLSYIQKTWHITKKYKKKDYFKLENNLKIKILTLYILLLIALICSLLYFNRTGNIKNLFSQIAKFNK